MASFITSCAAIPQISPSWIRAGEMEAAVVEAAVEEAAVEEATVEEATGTG